MYLMRNTITIQTKTITMLRCSVALLVL